MPNGEARWPKVWRPLPGEFGAMFNTLSTALNTAGPVLVGTATTNVYVAVPADKTFYVASASMQGANVFTGGSTVTATLTKKSGSTATALTGAYDLTAAVSTAGYANVPITASDEDATLAPGDTLYWSVAIATTFGPTTADLRGVVEISLIK